MSEELDETKKAGKAETSTFVFVVVVTENSGDSQAGAAKRAADALNAIHGQGRPASKNGAESDSDSSVRASKADFAPINDELHTQSEELLAEGQAQAQESGDAPGDSRGGALKGEAMKAGAKEVGQTLAEGAESGLGWVWAQILSHWPF